MRGIGNPSVSGYSGEYTGVPIRHDFSIADGNYNHREGFSDLCQMLVPYSEIAESLQASNMLQYQQQLITHGEAGLFDQLC